MPQRVAKRCAICSWIIFGTVAVQAHNPEARYVEPMPWHKEHFSKVLAMGYSELGLDVDQARANMKMIGGKACIVGSVVGFDVDDNYAFDVDEPVQLTLTYAPDFTVSPFAVVWNKNGGDGQGRINIRTEPGKTLRTVTLNLERARFAGAGTLGIDLAVGITSGRGSKVAVCDIQIARSGKTKKLPPTGRIRIAVNDAATGKPIPARAGLYDSTGRAPLASDQAILVERFADKVRQLPLNDRTFWPSANRVAFYLNGNYEAQVPAGQYELAVTRGPEYHAYYGTVDVRAGGTKSVVVNLKRYLDLPARGWYAGDSHIHLGRDETRDKNVWAQVAAEDVHVGNLLQMGSIAATYFLQPEWGEAGRYARDGTTIVSGQEDPRTGQLGHTIHHNITAPIHPDEDTYFLYQRVFEETQKQGGINGYAHLRDIFHVRRGLALDVPFGLVDFLEIMQAGQLATDIWYDFLNLGYKLTPAAGSDYPYTDLPGTDRNYVKVDGIEDTDRWFKSFKAGHVYVSDGPFLEFSVNGHQMGDEIHVERGSDLDINADVQLNPDVDKLDRLELIVEGDVADTKTAFGQDHISLHTTLKAGRSEWIAVRAYGSRHQAAFPGSNTIAAHSAPVYVMVGDEPSWKPEAVPMLVRQEQAALEEIRSAKLNPDEDLEHFSTEEVLLQQWPKQRLELLGRVDEADRRYRDLLVKLEQYRQR